MYAILITATLMCLDALSYDTGIIVETIVFAVNSIFEFKRLLATKSL
jgi:hypothetical protein